MWRIVIVIYRHNFLSVFINPKFVNESYSLSDFINGRTFQLVNGFSTTEFCVNPQSSRPSILMGESAH